MKGMVDLVLALPLACWGLAARTARTGWIVAGVLAFCAVAEIVLADGWHLTGERFTLVVVFALAAAVVLVAGIAAERRRPGGLRRTGARAVVGVVMSVASIAVSLAGIAAFVVGVLMYGPPASVPSAAGWCRCLPGWPPPVTTARAAAPVPRPTAPGSSWSRARRGCPAHWWPSTSSAS
jgi:hypothetical protein